MAIQTECQTPETLFHTHIAADKITVVIELPFNLDLNGNEAALLESNLHNVIELVLKPYFK